MRDESYLGGFIEGKFFESEFAKDSSTKGDNTMINFEAFLVKTGSSPTPKFQDTNWTRIASSNNYEFKLFPTIKQI